MRKTTTALLVLTAMLLGCRKGPDRDNLRTILDTRLAGAFEEPLFEIEAFSRRGSYPFTDELSGEDRVLIYFKARLRFLRDYRLGSWDETNLGSLLVALGAKPRGIEGVAPEGNKAGDVLSVHGSLAFRRDGDDWAESTPPALEASAPAGPNPSEVPLPYRQRMDEIGILGMSLSLQGREDDLAELSYDLERTRDRLRLRLARQRGQLTIATGVPSGEYHALGDALARLLTEGGTSSLAVTSSGSRENCNLLGQRSVDFAFVQSDLAHDAHLARGAFHGNTFSRDLRAVAALYPEAVQILIRHDDETSKISDLRGRTVDLGPLGSGARVNALQVLEAAGLDAANFEAIRSSAPRAAIRDLLAGGTDAVFLTSAWPSPSVAAVGATGRIRPLALGSVLVGELVKQHPFLLPLQLPARTYGPDQPASETVGVTALLVTHKDTPTAEVVAIRKLLLEKADRLGEASARAWFISPKTIERGLTLPLHPALQ